MIILSTIFFANLIFLNIIGYGIFLEKFNLKENNFLIIYFIKGSVFLVFSSLLINFFTPLNHYITNLFFFIGIFISLFFIFKERKFNFLLEIFLISLFVTLITYKSLSYNDYSLYHLPYMEILRNSKIIYGLSNFDPRYGHISIFQNISAIQYNFLMGIDSYIFFTGISIFISIHYIYKIFLKTEIKIVFFLCLISICYYLMHANRYGSLGNDMPAHIFSFISFILFFEIILGSTKNKKEKFKLFCFSIILSSLAKITLLLNFLLIIPIIFIDKQIIFKNLRIIIFISLVGVLFLYKNYVNTSCFIYPIKISCIQSEWSTNKYDFNSPQFVSKMSSVMVKDFMNTNTLKNQTITSNILIQNIRKEETVYNNLSDTQKKNFFLYHVFDYYDHVNVWIKPYLENHFKRKIAKEVLSLLFLNLIIFFSLFLYFGKNNNYKRTINKYEFFFISFIFISTCIWFFKAPILRYGLSYVLIFFNIPIFFLLLKKIPKDIIVIKKIYKVIFFSLLLFLILKNLIRIFNFNENKDYTKTIVPIKKPTYEKIIIQNYSYYIPTNGVCAYTPPLCTVYNEEFKKSGYIFDNTNNKLMIKKIK